MKILKVRVKDANEEEIMNLDSFDQAVRKITEALDEATSEHWEDKIKAFIELNKSSTLPSTLKFIKQAQDKLKKLQKIKSVVSSNWK